jgi:ABC-2 type transport system permease protein
VRHVVDRILLGVVPGSWFLFTPAHEQVHLSMPDAGGFHVSGLLEASWQSLGTSSAWIGAVAGVAMLAGAVWIRRHREEG